MRVGTLFNAEIKLHWSWWSMFVVFAVNSYQDGGLPDVVEFLALWAILNLSIVAHEFGHIFAARRYGLKAERILLTAVGGLASFDGTPGGPRSRFVIWGSGPLVSLVLALAAATVSWWLFGEPVAKDGPFGLNAVVVINAVLFLFNLIPVYPLDGGQILKALVLTFSSESFADDFASVTGQIGGLCLVAAGYFIGGVTLVVIGVLIFVSCLAEFIYRRRLRAAAAEGVPAVAPE